MALDMRTRVRLLPYRQGEVKVSSRGFETDSVILDRASFAHPLGLIFAVAYYFGAGGIHIDIESGSPPRSALGGSSVAAVALIAAISKVLEQMAGTPPPTRPATALLAHAIEESAAGVPCGVQDHLSAVYGGVNRWEWPGNIETPPFKRETLIAENSTAGFGNCLLVAYCGVPHESKDINGTWIRKFISGRTRPQWIEITECSRRFGDALKDKDIPGAVTAMNREMAIRKEMTPAVLDSLGDSLVEAATTTGCGARITGAGGGGCIWALGQPDQIEHLRPVWEGILPQRQEARLLDCGIDTRGVTTET
jgi:D-glycero-alpha-D-manno-heptose-7-phosphate kinase